jgi:hypothetical protein
METDHELPRKTQCMQNDWAARKRTIPRAFGKGGLQTDTSSWFEDVLNIHKPAGLLCITHHFAPNFFSFPNFTISSFAIRCENQNSSGILRWSSRFSFLLATVYDYLPGSSNVNFGRNQKYSTKVLFCMCVQQFSVRVGEQDQIPNLDLHLVRWWWWNGRRTEKLRGCIDTFFSLVRGGRRIRFMRLRRHGRARIWSWSSEREWNTCLTTECFCSDFVMHVCWCGNG